MVLVEASSSSLIQLSKILNSTLYTQLNHFHPFPNAPTPIGVHFKRSKTYRFLVQVDRSPQPKSTDLMTQIKELEEGGEGEEGGDGVIDIGGGEVDEFSPWGRFRTRAGGEEEDEEEEEEEEMDYDKNPEFADILTTALDDPEKARAKLDKRLRKKRNKILHTKTGSAIPLKVAFNKFNFSNSYIWFKFYNSLLEKDVKLLCDTLRSWYIVGRLGGCTSANMQLSQSPMDKRPSYDAIQGANVTPATFYNIGDLEVQDNLARVWVDIGTNEPLVLDILINALTQISTDHIGIKQVVFGGSEFENWRENLTSQEAGYSVNKI